MNILKRFIGKTVVVTGASSGIGAEIARRYSTEGANVVLAARRINLLKELAEELGTERTLTVLTDVTDENSVLALMQKAVDRFGNIDTLVSNAGHALIKPFEDTTSEDWDAMISINAKSSYLCAKYALPYLKKTRGSIVQIAALGGMGGDRQMSIFNAAKGALVNLTRGLAFDLGYHGIRVNAVAPGLTMTQDQAKSDPYADWVAEINKRQALSGHATPGDIAAAVAFLSSDDARFITGTVLSVDGGILAGSGQPEYF